MVVVVVVVVMVVMVVVVVVVLVAGILFNWQVLVTYMYMLILGGGAL